MLGGIKHLQAFSIREKRKQKGKRKVSIALTIIKIDGKEMTVREWAKKKQVSMVTVYRRLRDGRTMEQAITDPVMTKSEAGRLTNAFGERPKGR